MRKKINDFCDFFELEFPIIQGGMVWVSGAKLASACANQGIMGTIGAGSMNLDVLELHLKKARDLTANENINKLAINLPLLYHGVEKQIELALKYDIKNFITSAGSPKKYTSFLKSKNKKVIHVTGSSLLAKKCEKAGVDAIVAEGFEAGGHNSKDETTSMVLIPNVVDSVDLPIIAAGGIADPRQVHAAHALGASAVQVGSLFVSATESSAHNQFKTEIFKATEGKTKLLMKELVPVRLLENSFSKEVQSLERRGATSDELKAFLGKSRARKGMYEGNISEGELEIGQVSSMILKEQSAQEIIQKLTQIYDTI